jgi:hypothetical protein
MHTQPRRLPRGTKNIRRTGMVPMKPMEVMKPMEAMEALKPMCGGAKWWPKVLREPSTSGSQLF